MTNNALQTPNRDRPAEQSSASQSATCRSCGTGNLSLILSLGHTPLANALLTAAQLDQPEETFPLELTLCSACTLVQITETVPPEKLFRHYFYLSSFSDTMLRHARQIAQSLILERRLGPDSLVVEVASNDGYLLQYYKEEGIPVLGIEPAENIARLAEEKGIPTRCDFFGAELAEKLAIEGRYADVIHANNVLAHVADLSGVVAGFARLLRPSGILVVEVPYVKEMIDRCEFDTIYHEHLSYFSLTALDRLFRRHGLFIHDVEQLALHGGTLRVFAGRLDYQRGETVPQLLNREAHWGVSEISSYQGFAAQVERLRESLSSLLHRLKAEGRRIAVYGASAKGSTLLNYFGLGHEVFDFVVDRSTVKQGLYTPGTHLPIFAPEKLLAEMPEYVLLLTWNFADEVLAQQAQYRVAGGRFIIPIPDVQIV